MNKLLCIKNFSEKLHRANAHQHHHHSFLIKPLHSLSKAVTGAPFKTKPNPPHFLSPGRHSSTSSSSGFFKRFYSQDPINAPIKLSVGPRLISMGFPKLPQTPLTHLLLREWNTWRHGIVTDIAVLGLILANVGVYVMWQVCDRDFMHENFLISGDNIEAGRLHTLITSAFSHTDMVDLAFNMIGLYLFGMLTGRCLGVQAVVGPYGFGAYFGSKGVLYQTGGQMDDSKTPGLGASGAVNAIMLYWLFNWPGTTFTLNSSKPVPAILLGAFLIGKDVGKMIGSEGYEKISGTAHLGGAALAAAALVLLVRTKNPKLPGNIKMWLKKFQKDRPKIEKYQ